MEREPDPADGRSSWVRLTPLGVEKAEELSPTTTEAHRELLAGVPEPAMRCRPAQGRPGRAGRPGPALTARRRQFRETRSRETGSRAAASYRSGFEAPRTRP
ncbi:hypothetical protein GCM10010116_48430 [Microbispora rosea subsp. aerata]|nr:hypothetical protein GCM10010116_48430 [Microbispora rosea subsp. aerata]GIH57887.1 hypothetical protein Mro02_48010 [Microbispora rosea subsp. aerata]GLJ86099.1 hypothetical protein GCM10017588_48320 [Microbispora rosea subsp. aerata]